MEDFQFRSYLDVFAHLYIYIGKFKLVKWKPHTVAIKMIYDESNIFERERHIPYILPGVFFHRHIIRGEWA